jgi:CheY-like chemotaxis protein
MTQRRSMILLVDDDPVTQELFSILLEPNGMNVVAAATPAEARDRLASARPELVLLDLNLGNTDGLVLTRELRDQLGSSFPLLIVSASSDLEKRQRALAAGATDFIPKPVDPRTFASQVKKHLRANTAAADAELDPRERRLRELRAQFIETALLTIGQIAGRSDEDLLADSLLADAAHKWVGASSIEGMPDIEEVAREVETLARARRTDQAAHIRRRLEWLKTQFQASSERTVGA